MAHRYLTIAALLLLGLGRASGQWFETGLATFKARLDTTASDMARLTLSNEITSGYLSRPQMIILSTAPKA